MARPATSRLKVNPPLGLMPALQYLLPAQLEIDASYQRSLETGPSQTLVRRIAMFWNWDLCQPLVVARREDGRLFVIDGQHRLAAARLRGDIAQLPAVVVQYASAADEAASFVHLNQQRRPLNRLQIYRAALTAGDAETQVIQAALEEAGLWIASSTDLSIQKPGAIANLRGIEDCLRSFGAETLTAALDVLAQSFKGEVLRYSGTIFPGVAAIVADEINLDSEFTSGPRFGLMTEVIGGSSQAQWYADIGAKTAEIPTRKAAAAAVLREAWAECLGEAFEEAA